jgi:PKD-like domain
MKNIIRIILITTILFTGNLFSQTTVNSVNLNSQITINGCNTIDLGTVVNNNLTFYYTLTVPGQPSGKLYIKRKYSSSSNPVNVVIQDIQLTNWSGGKVTGTIACSLNAADIQVNGSRIYLEFVSSGNVATTGTCFFPLIKTPVPTFELSPTTASVGCGSNVPITFSVANVYNSPGTLSYIWYATGWKFNGNNVTTSFITTTNSISLTPASSTIFPDNVYVYPVLNGVQQYGNSCTVTSSPYTSEATITGQGSLCSSSTYSISSIPPGTLVSNWSIQGTSIATLSATSGPTTMLTQIGIGTIFLRATLTNTCGQTTTISKKISVGAPVLPNSSTINGPTYTGINQTQQYTFVGDSTNGGTSYQWSVDAPINDNGGPICGWQILSGQGTKTITLKAGCIATQAVVRVVANGNCGNSNTKYLYVTVGNPPCPPALRLSQNPIHDGNLTANLVYPPNCNVPLSRNTNLTNNEIKIYDFSGFLIYSGKQTSDELIINSLNLKKGIFF